MLGKYSSGSSCGSVSAQRRYNDFMSTYIIGDVQGCFDSLQALLQKINFDPAKDRLGFAGDLVNRGPKSLETLRFIYQLKNPIIVLGNHDLHLMALYFLQHKPQFEFKHIPHTLQAILAADDCRQLIHFLLQQPFLHRDSEKKFAMSHAGIPPQWSITQALHHALDAQKAMQNDPALFFEKIYGNHPAAWQDDLTGWDRARYIINALTRMRYCTQAGTLDLENKTDQSTDPTFRPWFSWIQSDIDIFFGHWASLEGRCDNPRVFALDTGCAWGRTLTALCVENKKIFSVLSCEKS